MVDVKKDKLDLIGDNVLNRIGFTPTSNAVKPISIANGLFRRCYGEYNDISSLHEWVVREAKRSKQEVNPASIIKEKYKSIIGEVDFVTDEELNEFRTILDSIYNHDLAAYPSPEHSVLNISSRRLIRSSMQSEASIDKFLCEVLYTPVDGKVSDIIEIINNLLKDDKDDLTRLIMPIISTSTINDGKSQITKKTSAHSNENDGILTSNKLIIRKGFDLIAKNIRNAGDRYNKLIALQRIVNFSCFAVIYNLFSLNKHIYKGNVPPIFLDSGAGFSSIVKASEESFLTCKLAVEQYFYNDIEKLLRQEIYHIDSDSAMQSYIDSMRINDDGDYRRKSLVSLYQGYLNSGLKPITALARSIQFMLFTDVYAKTRTNPSEFCSALGVRTGLVGPAAQQAKRKRFLPKNFLLETLAYSVIDAVNEKEGVEVREFANRLWNTYGIMFGARYDEEYEYLTQINIASRVPGDLRGDMAMNAYYLTETYISMGHGKRYADGVATIELEV